MCNFGKTSLSDGIKEALQYAAWTTEDRIIETKVSTWSLLPICPFLRQLPSVIIFRLEYNRPQNVNSLLKHYLKEVKEDLLAGAIVIFEESRVRVRRLPLWYT